MRLQGKTAVVTGATGGVGRSIATALAREGVQVAVLGRRSAILRVVARDCTLPEVKAIPYAVDLLKDDEVRRVKQRIIRDFGGVDILVHSAGVIVRSNLAAASLSDFDWQYRCNVRAPFALTQLFLPSLSKRHGQIVFVNSTAGLVAAAGVSQYSATKHALKALADSFREELNDSGVRVLSVYLGRAATSMQERLCAEEGLAYRPERLIQPSQVAETVVGALALGKEAEVMDIRLRPMLKPQAQKPKSGAR
ncbi:MAG TPA: SDR family NAD(P)-dependent oxidoreductase [Candidatus Sulfopaludibacter sp.]|nr:SDR family NAD(P)-dependent oxidoreductase [Candidatus Sulfopaludibacter sp.]